MQKKILLTGSTDGIGLEAAKMLVASGHHVMLHGRNPAKLEAVQKILSDIPGTGSTEQFVADLSRMDAVEKFAQYVLESHDKIDVLINNAGVYRTSEPVTKDGLDSRFAVNTIAPYLLTKRLLPILGTDGRVVNVSSAAQSPVDPKALSGSINLPAGIAYAQSKLALIMWSRNMALSLEGSGPAIISINPGSMLASKMVKEAYGVNGRDIRIGGDILTRAALASEFATASGRYFDNDSGQFAAPHPDALDLEKSGSIERIIADILNEILKKD